MILVFPGYTPENFKKSRFSEVLSSKNPYTFTPSGKSMVTFGGSDVPPTAAELDDEGRLNSAVLVSKRCSRNVTLDPLR